MSDPAAEHASGQDAVSPGEGMWLKHYDPFVPAHLAYPHVSVFTVLSDTAARHSERTCTSFFGRRPPPGSRLQSCRIAPVRGPGQCTERQQAGCFQ
jgi:hypothetical protein